MFLKCILSHKFCINLYYFPSFGVISGHKVVLLRPININNNNNNGCMRSMGSAVDCGQEAMHLASNLTIKWPSLYNSVISSKRLLTERSHPSAWRCSLPENSESEASSGN